MKFVLLIPYIRTLVEERDSARKKLFELQNSLRPFADYDIPDWPLPFDPKLLLQATPQRYSINYKKYLDRGGLLQPEDLRGFLENNPGFFFDRTRFYFFNMVLDMIVHDKIDGDIAELGVDKGNTAVILSLAAQRLGKTIYLLDTFEGFSEQDLVGVDAIHPVAFKDTSLEAVRSFIDGQHVRFIKGYFPESAQHMPRNLTFCLVHLDCDLYKPFKSALEFFWPLIVPGGFLIMHDYNSLYWDGVEESVNEFFLTKPESIIPIPDMAGTVCVRKFK